VQWFPITVMRFLNTCENFLQAIVVICVLQSPEVRFMCLKINDNLRGTEAEIRVSSLLRRKLQVSCHKELWGDSGSSVAIFLQSQSEMLLLNSIINHRRHSQTPL
jgi:hypothetical protein